MKRHKSLHRLSHEHQNGLVLALKLKYKKKPSSSALEDEVEELKYELADKFENELKRHFRLEETYLAPLFETNELMKRMLEEHKKLERLYINLKQNPENWDTGVQREKLNLFGELLELHIRFEERELFPMIEASLAEEEMEKLGEKLV
jgi:hemerythrin-like domain-containing protein